MDNRETGSQRKLDPVVVFTSEADELWSFVRNKKNQRWIWYAVERKSGIILAFHIGKRTDESCKKLFDKLSVFEIARYYTDNWQSYKKNIPSDKHQVGKDNTWKIERKNLNFRIHLKRLNRKTICFSKSEEMHDVVVGMYINQFYYKQGNYKWTA